jgi:hypothetical protein
MWYISGAAQFRPHVQLGSTQTALHVTVDALTPKTIPCIAVVPGDATILFPKQREKGIVRCMLRTIFIRKPSFTHILQ